MVAFPLATALPILRRSQLFNEGTAIMEPLSGIVDGVRRTFRTPNKPLIVDVAGAWGERSPLLVYDVKENLVTDTQYVVTSTREGTVQFKSPLTLAGNTPYSASYTYADLDLITLYNALLDGFYEMERRYVRGFVLTPILGSTTPLPGVVDMAITDAQGNDPISGTGTVFSQSAAQLSFLSLCALLNLSRNYLFGRAKVAYAYRESRMGMEVNPAASVKALADFQKMIGADLDMAMDNATLDWDSLGDKGAAIFAPSSIGYRTMFQWQQASAVSGTGQRADSMYGGAF